MFSALIEAVLLVGGFAAIVLGIWKIYAPAGIIALGFAMLFTFAVQQAGKRK